MSKRADKVDELEEEEREAPLPALRSLFEVGKEGICRKNIVFHVVQPHLDLWDADLVHDYGRVLAQGSHATGHPGVLQIRRRKMPGYGRDCKQSEGCSISLLPRATQVSTLRRTRKAGTGLCRLSHTRQCTMLNAPRA